MKTIEENVNFIIWFFTNGDNSPPDAEYKTVQPVKKNTNKIQITSQFIILHCSKNYFYLMI